MTRDELHSLIQTITSEPANLVEARLFSEIGNPLNRPVDILVYDIESAAELVKFDFQGSIDLAQRLGF